MFFDDKDSAKILGSFLNKSNDAYQRIENESAKKRLSLSMKIIQYIYSSPKDWDDKCTFNRNHIGQNFLEELHEFDSSKSTPTYINPIYVSSYRFLCEFVFLSDGQPFSELSILKEQFQLNVDELDPDIRSQMIYASYVMPANIVQDYLNNPDIKAFKDFENQITAVKQLNLEWSNELKTKKQEVEELKSRLDEQKIAFNFVGLNQGFANLAYKKYRELALLFWSLITIGFLALLPIIYHIYHTYINFHPNMEVNIDHFFLFIPVFSIEIIIIYFFRIVLLNYRSVKAQIMQIELRQTLCQFIQSYADYSSKIKKLDPSALDKFENLIFSGVLSNPEKLPSTYDGLEQIAALIKNIKNS